MEYLLKFRNFAQEIFSPNTVDAYLRDIRHYFKFMLDYTGSEDFKITDCDRLSIRSYLAFLHRNRYQSSTINRRVASLESFFEFMKRIKAVARNPALNLPRPKMKKGLPPFIGEKELGKLLDDFPVSNPVQLRDRAVVELFYGGGLRLAELIGLKLNDFEGGNFVRVMGKGSKERLVPLGKRAVDALQDYLSVRNRLLKDRRSDYLFISGRGNRLERRSVQRMIKRRLESISGEISPHSLRHAFATHLLRGGAEMRAVQELLGHESLTSTQIYTHLCPQDLQNAYKQAHPRA